MNKEIYWGKALKQTEISKMKNALFPLKTINITRNIYKSNDFIIRKLDTSVFRKKKIIGPKANPFRPWDKNLEIDSIGNHHHLILNKYPVEKGHLLLITNKWKPQNGWLEEEDWIAINSVNLDTSGLWFFNSCKEAGASQPHRHIQLLRRDSFEMRCPREEWFLNYIRYKSKNTKLNECIIVNKLDFVNRPESLYKIYLNLSRDIGLGRPETDLIPKKPYNLLMTNKWIAIIKRSRDNVKGFSVNGLGFAGYLLVTELSNNSYLDTYGPEKLLENFI